MNDLRNHIINATPRRRRNLNREAFVATVWLLFFLVAGIAIGRASKTDAERGCIVVEVQK